MEIGILPPPTSTWKLLLELMIYFIQGETTRRIKIGHTTRFIHGRMGELQVGSPDKLVFLGAHPGDDSLERALHRRFEKSLSHGEWFNESSELLEHIKINCIDDMKAAHSADMLVTRKIIDYKSLLALSHDEINQLLTSYLAQKLG